MSDLSIIDVTVHELQSTNGLIESSIHTLNSICEEIISDYQSGQLSLNDAINLEMELNQTAIDNNEMDGFNENMKKIAIKECKSLEEKLKSLIELNIDIKNFVELERSVRDKFSTNMNEFDETSIRQLLTTDTGDLDLCDNVYLKKFKSISGKLDGTSESDELVMDSAPNQIQKCPITCKDIQEAFRNRCGHIYEKSAIKQLYTRVRGGKSLKCPYAGCQGTVDYETLKKL
jgi:hypothetical protein